MRKRLAFIGIFFAAVSLHAQPEIKSPKNTVLIDLGPELTALAFTPVDVTGYGGEILYERMITDKYSVAGDIKTMHLYLDDVHFSVYDFGLNGRYYPEAHGTFFTNLRLGLQSYRSLNYNGWMLSIGLDAGWKIWVKSHLILEPYFGCHASSDDKFVMPFTITSLTGWIFPGLTAGLRFGACF